MPTIKDIAREAGVSQGTVSNVLNGKGNVSSVKIRQVQHAAEKLGYALNVRAQVLRRGTSNTLVAVLPGLHSRAWADFFTSFRTCATERGYQVALHLTEDLPAREKQALEDMQSGMAAGAAVFTVMEDAAAAYAGAGMKDVIFVERAPEGCAPVLTFDFYGLGRAMAEKALSDGCRRPALLYEGPFASQRELIRGLQSVLRPARLTLACVEVESRAPAGGVLDFFAAYPATDALFVANAAVMEAVRSAAGHFLLRPAPRMYPVSPLHTLPQEPGAFELNYRLLGRRAAELLIARVTGGEVPARTVLPPEGLRRWQPAPPAPGVKQLTLATLDSSSVRLLRAVTQMYTRATGVEVRIAAYSYEAMDEMLENISGTSFDIARLDSTHWSRYARRIFAPLDEIDPDIEQVVSTFAPGIVDRACRQEGALYALPHTPSTQLLFYRKDIFESTAFRRRYRELYGCELLPPATYAEYNRIAHFFTRTVNPESPVPYGAGLMLGDARMAAREFLSRYFSHSEQLYAPDGRILLESPVAVEAMHDLLALRGCVDPSHCNSWLDTLTNFTQGNAAMSIVYSNFTSNIMSTRSHISDRIGFAPVPGGHPMRGGSIIGVCRSSAQPQAAVSFLRWLCSEEVTTALALLGTASPCRKTYENYEVLDRCPWLLLAKDSFVLSRVELTPPNAGEQFDEAKFLGLLGLAVNTAFSGAMPVEDTLRFARQTFDKAFRQ